jgi:hypothetical protein
MPPGEAASLSLSPADARPRELFEGNRALPCNKGERGGRQRLKLTSEEARWN